VGLEACLTFLKDVEDPATRGDVLAGLLEALRGRKRVEPPRGWAEVYAALARAEDPAVRERSHLLGLAFNDPRAVSALQAVLLNADAGEDERTRAMQALVEHRISGLGDRLRSLLDDPRLRGAALRALSAYDEPETPRAILSRYARLTAAERENAVATLASRPTYAKALLDALEAGTVPRKDVSVTVARQLLATGDPAIASRLTAVWGSLRPTSGAKAELMTRYKARLASDTRGGGDASHGRLVFQRTCAQCHRMFDAGGDVGPDLTGSDRGNLDYVLENVLDPGALVGRDYTLTTVATADGRLLSGIVREQTADAVVLQTANDRVVIPREDIEELKPSNASMMPEGLFEKLTDDEFVDLVRYLASTSQVPLPNGSKGGVSTETGPRSPR
jgi:putative heme-binding domain-containing protein